MYAVLPTHTAEAGITLAMVGILLGVNRAVRLVFNGVAGWGVTTGCRSVVYFCLTLGAFLTVLPRRRMSFALFVGRALRGGGLAFFDLDWRRRDFVEFS